MLLLPVFGQREPVVLMESLGRVMRMHVSMRVRDRYQSGLAFVVSKPESIVTIPYLCLETP